MKMSLWDDLPKVKEETYVANFDQYDYLGINCVARYIKSDAGTYLDSFGLDHILKEIKNFIGNYDIIAIIYKKTDTIQ